MKILDDELLKKNGLKKSNQVKKRLYIWKLILIGVTD